MAELADFSVFTTVFSYCMLILVLPIATFFSAKVFLLDGLIGASNVTSNVWSAIMAIVMLHIALGVFIVRAYSDGGTKYEKKDEKVD